MYNKSPAIPPNSENKWYYNTNYTTVPGGEHASGNEKACHLKCPDPTPNRCNTAMSKRAPVVSKAEM